MKRGVVMLVIAGLCLGPTLGGVVDKIRWVDVVALVGGSMALGVALLSFLKALRERD